MGCGLNSKTIGGGGSTRDEQGAGAGGGLGWKNSISVVPGQSYYVNVGSGGIGRGSGNYSDNGGDLYFINTNTVWGQGGGGTGRNRWGSANRPGYGGEGGGWAGDGGGYGVNGGDG